MALMQLLPGPNVSRKRPNVYQGAHLVQPDGSCIHRWRSRTTHRIAGCAYVAGYRAAMAEVNANLKEDRERFACSSCGNPGEWFEFKPGDGRCNDCLA